MSIRHKLFILLFIISLVIFIANMATASLGLDRYLQIAINLLVALIGGYVAASFIFKPVQSLTDAAEMIQSGHLGRAIHVNSSDEFGLLAATLEKLSHELKDSQDYIHHRSSQNLHSGDGNGASHQENHFRKLFEFSNDAVFIHDFDGKMLNINKKACDMLGYSRAELLKILFLDLQIKGEVDRTKTADRINQKAGSLRYESVLRKKDESTIDVEISSSIIDMKRGINQSIVTNITERKSIEKSLKESEEKFRTFMETASDLMYITDKQGILIYVNEAMLRTLGYSKEELIGMSFHDIMDRGSMDSSRERRQQMIDSGEDIHEIVWETKTRKKIVGEMKTVAIYNTAGQFDGIRGIFRDITERKKVEGSQRLAEMGKLSADIAHEVKNQLAIIYSRAQIAQIHQKKNKPMDEDIQMILNQCEHVNDIVKRLLMFSKPSKGEFRDVMINEPIDFVIKIVEKQYSLKNVKIQRNLSSNLPKVHVDVKQIQEVLINLIGNAFEAMPGGGMITVTTSFAADFITIDISDTGHGISESDIQKIFNPFFTTKENGTGLGLSVCYGIIRAHQGELKYKSKIGQGTTATIRLPVAES